MQVSWRWLRYKAKLRVALSLAESSYVATVNASIAHVAEVHGFSANLINNVCIKMTKKVAKAIITKETNDRIREALSKQREVRKSTYGLGKGTASASTIKPASGDVSPVKKGAFRRMGSNVKNLMSAFGTPLSRTGSSAELLSPTPSARNLFSSPQSATASGATSPVGLGRSPTDSVGKPKLDWRGRPAYTGNYDTTSSETSPAVSGANSPVRGTAVAAADTAADTAVSVSVSGGASPTKADGEVCSGTPVKEAAAETTSSDAGDPPELTDARACEGDGVGGGVPMHRQKSCASTVTSFLTGSPKKSLKSRVKAAVKATKELEEKARIKAEMEAAAAAKREKLDVFVRQINKDAGHHQHQKKVNETDDEYYLRLAEMHQQHVQRSEVERAKRLKLMEEVILICCALLSTCHCC
jgi:hypothetical protein